MLELLNFIYKKFQVVILIFLKAILLMKSRFKQDHKLNNNKNKLDFYSHLWHNDYIFNFKVFIMTRLHLLKKVKQRKKEVGITLDNLSQLSNLGYRTVSRFFSGDDVKLSTVEKITNLLGLDFAGNEIIDIETLKSNRANQKALYIVSLVQDTSSLEMQGLEDDNLNILINETKEQFLTGDYQKNLWAS
jgi:transcriptional regulator with XRE-family HTH domain